MKSVGVREEKNGDKMIRFPSGKVVVVAHYGRKLEIYRARSVQVPFSDSWNGHDP